MSKAPEPVATKTDEELIQNLATDIRSALKSGDAIMVGDSGGDDGVPYWVRTGIPALDFAVGGIHHPGFPGSRIIEIFGPEAAGKSTLALWLTNKSIEQEGAIAYYQDTERVLTPEIIKGTGVNIHRVLRSQPDILEEVFDMQEIALKTISEKFPDKPVVICLDSIAACSTKAEIEGNMEASQVAQQARLMSKGLRKLKKYILDTKVLSVWVNQTRERIGGAAWMDNTVTAGGKAMAFYASVRLKVTKVGTLKDSNGQPCGCTIAAKTMKNKVAPPLREVKYDILFVEDENGSYPRIDVEGAVLDWLRDNKLIDSNTTRVTLEGKSMFRKQAVQMLREDKELMKKYTDLAYSIVKPLEEVEE